LIIGSLEKKYFFSLYDFLKKLYSFANQIALTIKNIHLGSGFFGTEKNVFLANRIALENIIKNSETMNFGIGLFSLEMSKMQVAERLLSSKAGINSNKIRTGQFDKDDWHKLGMTFNTLSKANLLVDDSSQLTIMQLRGKARQMKYKFMEIKRTTGVDVELKIIMVDYLQLMHGSNQGKRSFSSREQEVAEISRGLKALAKELNIPIIALAQLSRGVEARQDKPRLSDLRESGSIEQMVEQRECFQRYLKSDSSAEVEWLIMAHRQSMLELDSARLMHFFTM
jgi:replicative DNA helicase